MITKYMSRRSIRFRLTTWYSLVLGAGLILFALAIWMSMRQWLLSDVRQLLTHQIANTQAYVESQLREPYVQLGEELNEFSAAVNPGTFLRVANSQNVVVFDSNRNFP